MTAARPMAKAPDLAAAIETLGSREIANAFKTQRQYETFLTAFSVLAQAAQAGGALRHLVFRLRLALEQHLPPDPHAGSGLGHVCDAECEEMAHLGELLEKARRVLLAAPGETHG